MPALTISRSALFRVLAPALVGILTVAWDPSGARAATDTVADLDIQLQRDDIQLCEEALEAIERQAQFQMEQLARRKAFIQRGLNYFAEVERLLGVDQEMRQARAEKIAAAAEAMRLEGDVAFVPHSRVSTLAELRQLPRDVASQIRGEKDAISRGTRLLTVEVLGPTSAQDVADRVAGIDKTIDAIREKDAAGTFEIRFPILGVINRKTVEQRIADKKQEILDIQDAVARGQYHKDLSQLAAPGTGSKAAITRRIDGEQRNQTQVEAAFDKKTAQIQRPGEGTVTTFGVEQAIAALETQRDRVQRQIETLQYIVTVPGAQSDSRTSGQNLKNMVESAERAIRTARQQYDDGKYWVKLDPGNNGTNGFIQEMLSNPNASDKTKSEFRKHLARARTAFDVDVAISELVKQRHQAFLDAYPTVAKPALDDLGVRLEMKAALLGEFAFEAKVYEDAAKRRIDYLNRCLAVAPSP